MLQGTDSDGKSWVYEGSIMSGQKHGFGKLTFSNLGLVYEGEFYKGTFSGSSLELRQFAHADAPADKYRASARSLTKTAGCTLVNIGNTSQCGAPSRGPVATGS